jgi:hypothetical protein
MLDPLEAVLPSPLGITARREIPAKLPGLRPCVHLADHATLASAPRGVIVICNARGVNRPRSWRAIADFTKDF